MSRLAIFFLGPPHFKLDGVPINIVRRKTIALFAYLAVTREKHSRDSLCLLFWPDFEGSKARADLRRSLSLINKSLGDKWITASGDDVQLSRDKDLWVDVHEFRRLIKEAGNLPAAIELLEKAIELYRNDFLSGFSLRGCPEFDDWQFFQSESLRGELGGALDRIVNSYTSRGEYEDAISYARKWLSLDPLNEPAHCCLMSLFHYSGRRSAALRQYTECVRVLEAELGVEPMEETTELYDSIKKRTLSAPSKQREEKSTDHPDPQTSDEIRFVTVLTAARATLEEDDWEGSAGKAPDLSTFFQKEAPRIISEYEGYLISCRTKELIYIFGYPRTHEDDTLRALQAAMKIRERADFHDLSIGIDSGAVYIQKSGPGVDSGITINGSVINRSKLLCYKGQSGEILVGKSIQEQTSQAVHYRECPSIQFKAGKVHPAYKVVDDQIVKKRTRGFEDLHSKIIGRERELARLKAYLIRVKEGRGTVVCITGEAGVGKSRLLAEFKNLILEGKDADRLLWLEGRCLEMGMGAAYWPFCDMVENLFLTDQNDPALLPQAAGRYLDKIHAAGHISEEQKKEIGSVLMSACGIPLNSELYAALEHSSPGEVRARVFRGIADFMCALAAMQPVVLAFEDLHWADDLSIDLIGMLMDCVNRASIFLICIYRPEKERRSASLFSIASRKCPQDCLELSLRNLDYHQSEELVQTLLAIESLPPRLKHDILDRSQGSPLFLEELIRELLSERRIYREGNVWKAREDSRSVPVPDTIQNLVQSRVDRLEGSLKDVLQLASVLGRLFPVTLLKSTASVETDIDTFLVLLEESAFIYKEHLFPEEEYSFKHVLVQEAVYRMIPAGKRMEIHEHVGLVIETRVQEASRDFSEELAYHFTRSRNTEKALKYLLQAAEKSRKASLNKEAVEYYDRVIERAENDEKSCDWDKQRAAALVGLGRAHCGMGNLEGAQTIFEKAVPLCERLSLPAKELVRIYNWYGDLLRETHQHGKMRSYGEKGLRLLGDDTECLEAILMDSMVVFGAVDTGRSEAFIEFAHRHTERIIDLPYSEEMDVIARIAAWGWEYDKNVEKTSLLLTHIEENAKRRNNLSVLANTIHSKAHGVFAGTGNYQKALEQLSKALELYEKTGDTFMSLRAHWHAGNLLISLGRIEEAEKHFTLTLPQDPLDHVGQMVYHQGFCKVLMSRQEYDKAMEHCRKLLEIVLEKAWFHLAGSETYLLIGRIHQAQGAIGLAHNAFHQAIADFSKYMKDASNELIDESLLHGFSALDEACDDESIFLKEASDLSAEFEGKVGLRFQIRQEPDDCREYTEEHVTDDFAKVISKSWKRCDPFEDSSFEINKGLVIRVRNFRDLRETNQDAPRLVREASGDFAVQTVCVRDAVPSLGGLLLWKDAVYYLTLERGRLGKNQLLYRGIINRKNTIIGRGLMRERKIILRVERHGTKIKGLCGIDGTHWFSLGTTVFPVEDPLYVGVFASGNIDRIIYHGVFPEGTAIRFESFDFFR